MTVTLLKVFSPPPTDGSLALSALVDYNMKNNAEHAFAVLVDTSENGERCLVHVNYRQLGLAVHRVAHWVNPKGVLPTGTSVAILTSTDTIVNVALVLGVMRAGLVQPFPISPRASAAGICHLLVDTNTYHMVAGGSSAISRLIGDIRTIGQQKNRCLSIIPVPSFAELFPELVQLDYNHEHELFPEIEPAKDTTRVAILHSSGSTGLPRAIPYSQAGILKNFVNQPPCWQMGGPGARIGLMALPTFHVMGFMTQCFFPQCAGYTSVLFAPTPAPVVPSPHITLQTMVRSQCEFLLTVPAFLEAWSSDQCAIKILSNLKGVVYAGGPLTPWIGDMLVEQGRFIDLRVPIRAGYGSTELGAPVIFDLVRRAPEDWIYVEFPECTCLEFIPQNDEAGTSELVMLCTPQHVPFVINYQANGASGYATKDLVLRHPTKPELIKFVGRVDDQITLANGEKTNPIPMESEIIKCPLVRAAIMFGRERNQTGVLIELEDSQMDLMPGSNSGDVIDRIWPFIEQANQGASTHSRIVRDAILVASKDRPLPRTPKGNVGRAASIDLYSQQISAMYSRLACCSPPCESPIAWRNLDDIQLWLVSCVETILQRKPNIYEDLFQQGFDSLTSALLLRNIRGAMLAAAEKAIQRASENLSQRTIFSQPTIHQLAVYLTNLMTSSSVPTNAFPFEPPVEDAKAAIESMIKRYTNNLHTCLSSRGDSSPLEHVALTGTTGALGSHLLALMLRDDKVKRRQRASFSEKMFDLELLDHPKLIMLECDLADSKLGLPQAEYDTMQDLITTIIHNAWQVDFNLNIQSFEPSIRGTRNLLDLASKHGPRFVFTSSISSLGLGLPGRVYSEQYTKNLDHSTEFGYGESKYVAEKVLEVAKSMGYNTCIARIGQLTGDSTSGAWSKTDWIPAMVASSVAVGHLPDAIGMSSWIPLDTAARTLLEVCETRVKYFPPVVHVVHPRPVRWSSIMKAFAESAKVTMGKELALLPFNDWNQLVIQGASSVDPISARRRFPSTTIQTIFDAIARADVLARDRYGPDSKEIQALGAPCLETTKMDGAWIKTSDEVLSHFSVSRHTGLSTRQADAHATKYGKNELPEEPPTPLWELILEQFKDQLVLILLGSAVVSFVLALFEESDSGPFMAFVEPAVILLILVANAAVGVIQETKAERAIDALKEYSPDEAKVLRDGRVSKIHAAELVPGDIISISVGDKIPADCRIISILSSNFRVDQAILTGESESVSKSTDPVNDSGAVKQDMTNMVFSGTTVVNGTAQAVVVQIGEQTAIGDIHRSISSQISEKTPLKRKLDDFGDMLAKVITVICVLVWLVNIRHFWDPSHHSALQGAVYYFKIAVALAVAAIPEGLAAVITACLALGTKKMAQKNAIVRNLPSVETLGCTNVICSDKTGTLTTNQMSVARFLVIDATSGSPVEYTVEGTTFSPSGSVSTSKGQVVSGPELQTESVVRLSEISALCNDAKIIYNEEKASYTNVGEPTEAALRVLVEKIGSTNPELTKTLGSLTPRSRSTAVNDFYEAQYQRLLTFDFSRDRKMMSVLVRSKISSGPNATLFVKGAPESVLERCKYIRVAGQLQTLTPMLRDELLAKVSDVGSQGLPDYAQFERDLVFVGLVGMLDPPRPEVRAAIANCRAAGIRVICITGDNKKTAEAICRQIGIFGPDEDLTGKSYTGRELDALSHEEKALAVQRASVFSRTEPGHKSQLVDLLQDLGLVVAMTGDGVNDAPALKKADIGVAMGSGTDVAKLAADMVLADSNFATIEQAVEEGRLIYNNTKQFIRYLISSNIGEVVSIFLTVLLGMPEALIPVQLLWVNLVTDSLPATALGFNPADHTIMRMPPRNVREPLVGKWLFVRYLIIGTYVGVATVFGYAWWFIFYEGGPQISFYQLTHFHQCSSLFPEIGCAMFTNEMAKRATTMSLSILVTVEMFNAANSLSENESLLVLPIWKNPFLVGAIALSMALHFAILYIPFFTTLFAIAPLNWLEWKAVLLISFPVVIIDEVLKYISGTFIDPPSKIKID
ncbi:calcium transporting ATPase [Ceratobasidium sp. AG-Ba]|nr:calcium transporting ATPase [Ceratobasidium sp. AG-Ba]